jgi:hypothetical protein
MNRIFAVVGVVGAVTLGSCAPPAPPQVVMPPPAPAPVSIVPPAEPAYVAPVAPAYRYHHRHRYYRARHHHRIRAQLPDLRRHWHRRVMPPG